jgi:hypothetical protein
MENLNETFEPSTRTTGNTLATATTAASLVTTILAGVWFWRMSETERARRAQILKMTDGIGNTEAQFVEIRNNLALLVQERAKAAKAANA